MSQNESHEDYRLVVEVVHAEINFLKGQQWHVTNYGLLLYAALVTVSSQFTRPDPCILAIFAVIAGGAAIVVVCQLHKSIDKHRELGCRAWKQFPEEWQEKFPEYVEERKGVGLDVSAVLITVLGLGLVLSIWLLLGKGS